MSWLGSCHGSWLTHKLPPFSHPLASSHLRILFSGLGIAGKAICDLSGPASLSQAFPDVVDAFHAPLWMGA